LVRSEIGELFEGEHRWAMLSQLLSFTTTVSVKKNFMQFLIILLAPTIGNLAPS
jgi:hypothetical protein